MNNTVEIGNFGEVEAEKYLISKGYEILEKKFRYQSAEIDIIAKQNNELVFIEVKTRKTNYFGEPEEFVTKAKQKLIIKAANAFICNNNLDNESRFDIISILYNSKTYKINHIESAYFAMM